LLFAQNSFTDSRDGKAYKTVKIGSRTWMAENLNYDANGSKCYNNETENCQKYGRLYDFSTAEKSCPTGWHLPTLEEFERLEVYKYEVMDLEKGNIGKRLKAKNGWNGTDDFGFSALPAGCYRVAENAFTDIDTLAYLWTSTIYDSDSIWRIVFIPENNQRNVLSNPRSNKSMYSIRCVKDDSNTPKEKAEREAEEIEKYKALRKFKGEGRSTLAGGFRSIHNKNKIDSIIENIIENKIDINSILEKCKKLSKAYVAMDKINDPVALEAAVGVCQKAELKSMKEKIKDSLTYDQKIDEIENLLKSNYLEECNEKCKEIVSRYSSDKKFVNLCRKQLVDKVRKIPMKKLNSNLASVYFYNEEATGTFPLDTPKKNAYVDFGGMVIQNTGKMALLSLDQFDFIVKHSSQCQFVRNMWFNGYGKYLGMETYTTVLGVRRSVPAVQLLWCNQ